MMVDFYIPVILGTARRNNESIKVARFAAACLKESARAETELLDLKEMNLPVMEERLRFRDDPPPSVSAFSTKIKQADAIVIVTPEYSGGYPGVLKNALDYLKDEYRRKPFGIITVSAVETGGILCLVALRQVILHLGGVPIPGSLLFPRVQESFDPEGKLSDPALAKRARSYFEELLWFTEAFVTQKKKDIATASKSLAPVRLT
jgi:NAD(P)H-dependent FMN reductase